MDYLAYVFVISAVGNSIIAAIKTENKWPNIVASAIAAVAAALILI